MTEGGGFAMPNPAECEGLIAPENGYRAVGPFESAHHRRDSHNYQYTSNHVMLV